LGQPAINCNISESSAIDRSQGQKSLLAGGGKRGHNR